MTTIKNSLHRNALRALGLVGLGLLLAASPALSQVQAFNAFPTGDVTDGRMLALANGFESLSGQKIELSLAVPPGDASFTFQIFDGETGGPCRAVDPCVHPAEGHWDDGTAELIVSMYFDPDFDPLNPVPTSSLTLLGQWFGNATDNDMRPDPFGVWTGEAQMLDNDFWDLLVTVTPAAVTPSGAAFYRVLIEIDETVPGNSASAFKVLSTVPISLLSADFGFLASLQEVQNDGPIIYPTWDGVTFPGLGSTFWQDAVAAEDTTYDGTWSFFLNVPEGQQSLSIFDGDFDFGTKLTTGLPSQVTIPSCADDDDANSPMFPPFIDPPLPDGLLAQGAQPFGIPADDNNLDIFRRNGCVTYTVTDPDGNVYSNDNPSSDKEWEQFLIATAASGLPGDHIVSGTQLPSGLWQIDISGLDMSNLNFWHFDFLACGAPCDPPDPYLIGDTVFFDSNANGVQDSGEPGIPGVKLNRRDAGGGIVDMATTDENGNYFISVLKGTWTVEVAPENFTAMPELGALGDRVWLDLDADGLQDAGEPGIANVTVRLFDLGSGLYAGSTVTDANGNYLFDNLEPGDYRTEVTASTLPAGLTQSGGSNPSATRTITSNEVFLDLDFGYVDGVDGILGDFVWRDADNDGVQDPGEPGIRQVKLNLWDVGLDGMFGTVDDVFIGSTKTAADGSYLFTGLAPATYVVEVDATAFAVLGPLFGNTVTVGPESEGSNVSATRMLLAGGVDLTVDFGYDAPAGLFSVSDVVWFDADSNGMFDGVDMAIPGVTVNLLDDNLKVIATTVSDSAGAFSFDGLPAGTYTIEITDVTRELTGLYGTTQPGLERSLLAFVTDADLAGVNFGYINGGALEGLLSSTGDTLTRTVVDMNILTYDFGYYPPGSIGDFVWEDLNGNGVQEAGEPGILGATVRLLDGAGNLIATTTTDGTGFYEFTGLDAGDYIVEFVPPAGREFTTPDQGGDDALDSDANPASGRTGVINLAIGENDDTIDAGLAPIPVCDLALTMTCEVQAPPPGDLACTGKISATTMRYTGPDILGATVEFDPDRGGSVFYNGIDLISGVTVLSMAAQNDFSIDATAQGETDLGAKMKIWIDGVPEELHTSCSTPYVAGLPAPLNNPKGDPSPNWFVENFRDKNGHFAEVPSSTPSDFCTISAPDALCSERPTAIGLRFNGGDCTQSSNTQPADKWSCSGDAGGGPVRIVATSGSNAYLDESGVAVGNVVDILASAAGRNDLDSNIDYEIYVGGALVQEINFHTSCSQDLRVGDKFGSLEVVYYENDEQGRVEIGADVEFTYFVENIGGVNAAPVSVDDVPFGPIGTHPLLLPGESVTFSNTVFINATVTNTGTATGNSAGGMCSATDTTTVEVEGAGEPSICLPELDFETDGGGAALQTGQIIDDEWAALGMTVSFTVNAPGTGPAMIFDSANPTGGDPDLGAPNQTFGGPGVGAGGESGQPGENRFPLGKILIISEDGDQSDPDDNGGGGTIIFTFDQPVFTTSVGIIDIDGPESMGTVTAFDASGNVLAVSDMQPLGDNSVQQVPVVATGVRRLEIMFPASGGVSGITFCEDDAFASLGDRVWEDSNGNGVQEAGEPGINNVTVELLDAAGAVIGTAVTAGDGIYGFAGLTPGDYTVRIVTSTLPATFAQTFDLDGLLDDQTTVSLAAGDDRTDVDFGYRAQAQQACALQLTKTCEVQAPPPGALSCTDKIQATTMRYTGPDIFGATVEFDPDKGASVFYNGVDLISGVTVLSMASQNDFSIDATSQGESELGSKTKIWIDGVAEELHTSCSQPYVAGQPAPLNSGGPSPNWFVENFRDKSGHFAEVPAPTGPSDFCSISGAPDTLCTQRPTAIGLRFNGGDCTQSSNTQSSDKWYCSGDAGGGPVRIVAANGSDVYLDQSGVGVGDLLDILASAVGRNDLDSEIDYEIYVGGSLVQTVNFHTSCSQDLRVGDKFGSLEVVYYENDEQGRVEAGADVDYVYLIENIGAVNATNIVVDDDPHGPIGTHPFLAPGQSVTLSKTIFVNADVTNLGMVTADGIGLTCSATDTATVDVEGDGGTGGTCTPVTVRDEFGADSFGNNDGPDDWAGDWVEDDVAGAGPTAGNVTVWSGKLSLMDYPDTGTEPSVARTVDLSGADAATLAFDFWTTAGVDDTDAVRVEVSSDGGATYTLLEEFSWIVGATSGSRSYDISAFTSAQTTVRFRVTNLYGGGDEYFKVDNVDIAITCDGGGGQCTPVTARDEFSADSFGNNDGPDDWAGDWVEDDVAGAGPTAGNIKVWGGKLSLRDKPDTGTEPSAARTVDLSGADAATLSFDFWTTPGVDDTDAVVVEVSSDGGASYTPLEEFSWIDGPTDGSRSYDITAYISAQTTVRFRVTKLYGGSDEYFKVDNLEISGTCDGGGGQSYTVSSRVSHSMDDVEERTSNGSIYTNSSDLELTSDGSTGQVVGMRFRNVDIPQGATVTAAYIEFETDETNSGSTSLTVRAQRADNAGAFSTSSYNVSGRSTTGASVPWSPPAWNTVSQKHQTPDLAAVVQEVVNRGGWASGNSMVFVVTGSGERTAESYDGESSNAPELVVTYTTP